MAEDTDTDDIVILAVPPTDLSRAQRLRLARTIVEMLKSRGFACMIISDEDKRNVTE